MRTTSTVDSGKPIWRSFRRCERGYTLIEIVIVLSIIGIFLASGLRVLQLYHEHQSFRNTDRNFNTLLSSMESYLASNGHYPCPAPLNVPRGEPGYGVQTDCADTSIAVGNCEDGICIEESIRIVELPNDHACQPFNGGTPGVGACEDYSLARVRRGAIPFRVMNLEEGRAYDGYGRRIEYVVTERLASPDLQFHEAHGGIHVVDDQDRDAIAPIGTAHFLLLSRGRNGMAGWSRDGVQQLGCDGSAVEMRNCDTETDGSAVYVSTLHNLSEDGYFDDIIAFRTSIERPLWRVTDSSYVHITDLTLAGGGTSVGGDINPGLTGGLPRLYLSETTGSGDETGIIRAQGNLQSDFICSPQNDDCFRSLIIGGAGMRCTDPDQFMIGIQGGAPVCADVPANTCPPGQLMRGIDADMQPICSAPPSSCPVQTITVCGVDHTLPASLNGTQFSFSEGATRQETWECDGTVWDMVSSSGNCDADECPATDVNVCGITHTLPAGPAFPATPDITICEGDTRCQTYRCSNFTWSQTSASGSCVCPDCTPAVWTDDIGCATHFVGERIREYTRTCPPDTGAACSSTVWTEISNTCECNCADGGVDGDGHLCRIAGTGMSNRTRSCPTGFNSGVERRQCPRICNSAGTGTWNPACTNTQSSRAGYACETLGCTPWDDSECACTARPPNVTTLNCPSGYDTVSTGTETYYWNCPGGSSAPGHWDTEPTIVPPVCECNLGTQYRTRPCSEVMGPEYGGTVYESRDQLTCPATWSAWSEYDNSCYLITCSWNASGSFDPSGSGSGPQSGGSCGCGAAPRNCHVRLGPGDFHNYHLCSCLED
jgi:prepilin-type N-terminal cleavage/methylation domain-containing protein